MPCLTRPAARITKNTSSPLLDLPPELRLMIYGFTYDLHDEHFQHSKSVTDLEPTSLLQVNQQIRSEAAPHFDKWFRACSRELDQAACAYTEKCELRGEGEDGNADHRTRIKGYRMEMASVRARGHTLKCILIVRARCATRADSLNNKLLRMLAGSVDDLNEEIANLDATIEELAQLVDGRRA